MVAAASFAVFGTGIRHMSNTLKSDQDQGGWQSIPGYVFSLAAISVTSAVRIVFVVALAIALLWLMRRVWQSRMDWIDGARPGDLRSPGHRLGDLPWYVSWMLPLAAQHEPPAVERRDADDLDRSRDE